MITDGNKERCVLCIKVNWMSGQSHPYNKTKADKWKVNNFSWTHKITEVTGQTPSPQTAEVMHPEELSLLCYQEEKQLNP